MSGRQVLEPFSRSTIPDNSHRGFYTWAILPWALKASIQQLHAINKQGSDES